MKPIGRRRWAIAEGYIPGWSHGPEPQMTSHECICFLNAGDDPAEVSVNVFYTDRDPVRYRLTVPPRRSKHVRLRSLTDPEPGYRIRRADRVPAHAPRFAAGGKCVVKHHRIPGR